MYISELLCGIVLGAVGMLALIVSISLIYSHKNKKNKE